jgi:hypothetical protein
MMLHRVPGAESPELSGLEDEALVTLAQSGSLQAEHTLVLRYLPHTDRLVEWLAQRSALGVEDTADAKQEAVSFWVRKAIRAYDLRRSAAKGACRFRRLHDRIVAARFRNYARALQSRAAYHAAGGVPEECPAAHRDRLAVFGHWEGADNPAEAAEWHELRGLLDRAVADLPEPAQRLWEWVSAGRSLRRWSRRTGIGYKRVQRSWRTVVRVLMARLRHEGDKVTR